MAISATSSHEAPVPLAIRDALPTDAPAIAAIYNEGIVDRQATLETALRTPEERRRWLAERSDRHPVIVAVEGATVVGWASLNRFSPRAAYDHVADFSVYVARDRRGAGVGIRLLRALEARADQLGYHKLVLAALLRNAAGLRLYRRCGFQEVGVYHEQGLLDGQWVDVVLMEKILR